MKKGFYGMHHVIRLHSGLWLIIITKDPYSAVSKSLVLNDTVVDNVFG